MRKKPNIKSGNVVHAHNVLAISIAHLGDFSSMTDVKDEKTVIVLEMNGNGDQSFELYFVAT